MSVATRVRFGTAVVAALATTATLGACSSGSSKPAASPTAAPPSASTTPSASASPSGDSTFVDAFDNNDNDWPTRSDSDGTKLAVTGGEYQVTLPAGSIRYIRPAALAQREDVRNSVSVAARVKVTSGKTFAFGLACRMNPTDKQYYIGRLFENGTSAIVRREKGKGERILRASRANPLDLDLNDPIDLVMTCGEKDGKMALVLRVNGKDAVSADDSSPLPQNPPGIYAVAGLNTPTSSFAFDDVSVSPFTP